jgi:DNA-directed RNA polymerase beta subunit
MHRCRARPRRLCFGFADFTRSRTRLDRSVTRESPLAARASSADRYSFASLDEVLELPDLIAVQRKSFEWLLAEGLRNTFRDISPIKDFSETLQLELEFDPTDEDLEPIPKFSRRRSSCAPGS